MPRTLPRVVLAARTPWARRQQRAGIRLRDYTVTERTKQRYEVAVGKILPFLESQPNLQNLDGLLCDWIELQWTRGEAVNAIADTLSGLHFFWPELRGLLRQAWKMFKSWRRIEAPRRAPPLTVFIVRAVTAYAVQKEDLPFALFSLGFHCLLRTGELLALRYADIEFTETCGVVSLMSSKSGLRTGTEEAVAIRDPLVLNILGTLKSTHCHARGQKLWPFSANHFRQTFQAYMRFFRLCHLQMKPYSLRRGGATFLLEQGLSVELILLRGRWKSLGVARLYLEDGLAQLPQLRISPADRAKLQTFADQCPKTAFRPWMGPWIGPKNWPKITLNWVVPCRQAHAFLLGGQGGLSAAFNPCQLDNLQAGVMTMPFGHENKFEKEDGIFSG